MKCIIKYVLDTVNQGLKMTLQKKENIMNIVAYSDSDLVGNKESRISVSGFILLLNNAPIRWRSKAHHSVMLSSSEADYVALSEAEKAVKFTFMLLKIMSLEVKLTINARVYNVGAIFMSENVTTSNRTKHVETRYKFVNEFVEADLLKLFWLRPKTMW